MPLTTLYQAFCARRNWQAAYRNGYADAVRDARQANAGGEGSREQRLRAVARWGAKRRELLFPDEASLGQRLSRVFYQASQSASASCRPLATPFSTPSSKPSSRPSSR